MSELATNPDWAQEASTFTGGSMASSGMGAEQNRTGDAAMDNLTDRTAMVAKRLKEIYRKSVLPVEKRFRYDYFYESPFFDGC
mmetsp:Transcript_7660/g.10965  ORF Transcript_7660/g.10965 Transcript_7660/m.10965 type:complete len:83 (+) Transcript_7660:403-651(+)